MKVRAVTLGCKVNTYESEYVLSEFKKKGYEITDGISDIYIINTCSVTNMSDSKSRKIINKIIRENNSSIIVVMGCMIEAHKDYENDRVNIIIGNKDKSKVVELVEEYLQTKENKKILYDDFDSNFEDMFIEEMSSHTRAYVKIQDGCENFCSYCIIPYTRGRQRSKKKETVLKEINTLVQNGYQEVVLTGIHTGHYGADLKDYDFSDLLMELEKIEGLERIRISSIEITELNDKFLNVLKKSKKIVDHIHIPLQSGCDKILKLMNRKYDMNYYIDKINTIKSIRPNIAITTDVIVGFPDEEDEDFEITRNNIEKIGFTELHVFPYSKREGTVAANMKNQIDGNIKKERVKTLIELSEKLKEEYYLKSINNEEYVLTETINDNIITGHLSNYGKVLFEGDKEDLNKLIKVKLTSYNNGTFNAIKVDILNSKFC